MAKLKRIRIGNDFTFLLEVKRDGVNEDLTNAYDLKATLRIGNRKIQVPSENISYSNGYIVRVELTPDLMKNIGEYWLEFRYILPDNANSDRDLKCAVDADVCEIVSRTAQADDIREIVGVGDVLIGLRGESTYEAWLKEGHTGSIDDFFEWLREPTYEARDEARGYRDEAEGFKEQTAQLKVDVTALKSDTNQLKLDAETAKELASGFATDAETAKSSAESAATNAELFASKAEEWAEKAESMSDDWDTQNW